MESYLPSGDGTLNSFGVLISGAHTYDTAVKFSGSGSLRFNYPIACQGPIASTPCGGWTDRLFPSGPEHYGRLYLRVSSDFQWGAANGSTKIIGLRGPGTSRFWPSFYFGLNMIVSAENTPTDGQTTNIPINTTMPREIWTCFEWHYIANTPGVANGTLQTWKDGVLTTNRSDVQWRGPTNTSHLNYVRLYRQSGFGSLWFDRIGVGDTRIGCIGAPPVVDTTPPTAPSSLVAQ